MKNVLQFRAEINALLADILGTYKLPEPNNQEIPSLSVLEHGFPPEGTSITGLEVVIIPSFDIDAFPVIGGRKVDRETQIVLKQWDKSKTTLPAIDRLIQFLPNSLKVGPRLVPLEELDNIETCTLTFTETFITYGNHS